MVCYKDGDVSRGGFRYLTDSTICVDFCEENNPIDSYLKNLVLFVNGNNIKKIFINGPLVKKIDISFLSELKMIESVRITANCESLKPIYSLTPKALKMQIQDEHLDFSQFRDSLEEIELYNLNPHNEKNSQLSDSILKCDKLKSLSISNFDNADCKIMREITWLQDLELANCNDKKIDFDWINELRVLKKLKLQRVLIHKFEFNRLSFLKDLIITQLNLSTLDGVQNLNELEYMNINYCSKLTDISALTNCIKLRKLEFENTEKISNFEQLRVLQGLQGLILSNCGNIQSLKFINSMDSLKFLSFVDTNIVDGDLTPCLRLKYVGTMDKRHYNLRASELPHNKEFMFQKL